MCVCVRVHSVGEDTAVDVVMEEKRPVSHHFWSYVACCFCPLFGFMSWLKAEEVRTEHIVSMDGHNQGDLVAGVTRHVKLIIIWSKCGTTINYACNRPLKTRSV